MTRRDIMVSLHTAHMRAWDRGPERHVLTSRGTGTETYMRYYRWRMEWWDAIAEAFAEEIKGGVRAYDHTNR